MGWCEQERGGSLVEARPRTPCEAQRALGCWCRRDRAARRTRAAVARPRGRRGVYGDDGDGTRWHVKGVGRAPRVRRALVTLSGSAIALSWAERARAAVGASTPLVCVGSARSITRTRHWQLPLSALAVPLQLPTHPGCWGPAVAIAAPRCRPFSKLCHNSQTSSSRRLSVTRSPARWRDQYAMPSRGGAEQSVWSRRKRSVVRPGEWKNY